MAHRLRVLITCLVGTAGLLAVAAVSGFIRLPGSEANARPACDALPTHAAVVAALRDHREVTSGLRSAAKGVQVSVSRPCSGKHADRALIEVAVPDGGTDAVRRWLDTHDGYGVPLQVDD